MSLTSVLPLLLIVVVVLIAVKRGGAPWRKLRLEPGQVDTVMAANARMQARNLLAFGAGIILLAVLTSVGMAWEAVDLGRIVLVAPMLAATGAVVVVAIAPTATLHEPDGQRAAELAPRRPWDFGARWMFVLSAVLLLALVAVFVMLGLSADDDGRSVTRVTELTSTSASPYPGFFYGMPLLIVTVVEAIVTGVALARIASAPRPTAEQLRSADDVLRRVSTGLVLKLASAAAAATLGVVLVLAGNATKSMGDGVVAGGEVLHEAVSGLELLASVESIGGFVLLGTGIALLLWAVRDAARIPLVFDSAAVSA
jgi:hypothetical protein